MQAGWQISPAGRSMCSDHLDAASDTVTVTLSYKTLPAPRDRAPRRAGASDLRAGARRVREAVRAVPDARFQRVLDQIREVLPG